MLVSSRSQVDLMLMLRMELHTVSEWLRASRLTLNTKKTKYCIFASKPKVQEFRNYSLSIHGVELERVRSFKYLGMILDEALAFDEHIDHLHHKVSNRMGILCCSRKYLNVSTRVLLYKSLISPHLEFGDTIYCTCSADNLKRLQVLQNTACRIILRCDNMSPTFQLHIDLNLLPLSLRRHIRTVCECYKSVKDESYCLNQFFAPVARVTGAHTRGVTNKNMQVPKCKTGMGQKAFAIRGPKTWNSIPTEFQAIETFDLFKSSYSKYVYDKFVRGGIK